MRSFSYAIACIVLPALWGLVASWVYDRIAARRVRQQPDEAESPDMFHI